MRKYVNMVIKGINPSVILCGAPGTGKTYNVKQQLKAAGYREGVNMYTIKGRCSARQLYMALYQYRAKGNIVVIDVRNFVIFRIGNICHKFFHMNNITRNETETFCVSLFGIIKNNLGSQTDS